jgi:hypothetical protein
MLEKSTFLWSFNELKKWLSDPDECYLILYAKIEKSERNNFCLRSIERKCTLETIEIS